MYTEHFIIFLVVWTGPGCRGAIAPWATLPKKEEGPFGQQIQLLMMTYVDGRWAPLDPLPSWAPQPSVRP